MRIFRETGGVMNEFIKSPEESICYNDTEGRNAVTESTQNEIDNKLSKLKELSTLLKSKYVGIDDAIDSIINYMISWYMYPEAQVTPCVICLWGMTGCGKTSIVQDIVEFLDMSTHFITSIQAYEMDSCDISEDKPLIVLFDEMQNRCTRNSDGSRRLDYEDRIWEFLSSGAVNSMSFYVPRNAKIVDGEIEGADIPNVYAMLLRSASNDEEALDMLKQFSKKTRVLLSQSLVFVSGNLDGAYPGAIDMNDESDADQFYELSKRVTLQVVRQELNRMFFPEHISRLGSNHVIFPAFNTESYQKMIALKSKEMITRYEEVSGRNIYVTQRVLDYLYNISVVPAQGARPLTSTVHSFLGYYIPMALCSTSGDIKIDYLDGLLVNGSKVPMIETVRRKDIRSIPEEELIYCMVHEAGHVTAALVLGLTPFSVSILDEDRATSNFNTEGLNTSENMKDYICMVLSGRTAQNLLFGNNNGCRDDISKATTVACNIVRMHTYGGEFSREEDLHAQSRTLVEHGQHDSEAEAMLNEQSERSEKIIKDNVDCLKACIDILREKRKITSTDMTKISEKYGMADHRRKQDYDKFLSEFGGKTNVS